MTLRQPAVILVTGGASGIGAAMVRHLAAAGHQLVVADTDVAGGASVAKAAGAVFVRTDVRDYAANQAAVRETTDRFGGLDAVCLNAGISGGGRMNGEDFDPGRYRLTIGVNLDGVVYGLNAALPALRARGGGSILITASLAGLIPTAFDPYYGATKHAVIGLMRSFAVLLQEENITVNAICPGFADTAIIAAGRDMLIERGVVLADPGHIAAAAAGLLDSPGTGQAWEVQASYPAEQVSFPEVDLSRSVARD